MLIAACMFLAGINVLLGFYILYFLERSLLMGTDQEGFWIPVIRAVAPA